MIRRYLVFPTLFLATWYLGWVNVRLWSADLSDRHLVKELAFLQVQFRQQGLGSKMQKLYPEGFVFVNAMYGLSWCELDFKLRASGASEPTALVEATYAYDQINSAQAHRTFQSQLVPAYGIFYAGWRNYLLSKIIGREHKRNIVSSVHEAEFEAGCDAIADAVNSSPSPWLESYQGLRWPADMFPAIASLCLHDQLFSPKYQSVVDLWLKKVMQNLDPVLGMVPHQVDSLILKEDRVRGSSTALIIALAAEINPAFANDQLQRFSNHFCDTILGLPFIREYPIGEFGIGDVDSGPVFLGIGPVATIVGIGAFGRNNHLSDGVGLYHVVDAFGLWTSLDGQARYLFGTLPIADAFIAWVSTSLSTQPDAPKPYLFTVVSGFFVIFMWALYFRKWLFKRLTPARQSTTPYT